MRGERAEERGTKGDTYTDGEARKQKETETEKWTKMNEERKAKRKNN